MHPLRISYLGKSCNKRASANLASASTKDLWEEAVRAWELWVLMQSGSPCPKFSNRDARRIWSNETRPVRIT